MKLIDAIKNVDKSDVWSIGFDDLCEAVDASCNGWSDWAEHDKRIKGYPLVKWLCTDTHVGVTIVYFDDEPVAIIQQTARKSGKDWSFLSEEAAEKLRQYALSHVRQDKKWELIDPNEEIGDTYTVNYGEQLLVKEGLYNGKPVKVLKTFRDHKDIKRWHDIVIEDADNSKEERFSRKMPERVINVKDLKIPYHLEKTNG
jgi:hypothetical protein